MLYENIFNVDYNKLVIQLLPTSRRKPLFIAFSKILMVPFNLILNDLKNQRQKNIYRLQHDSRIGKIEKVLNDSFDRSERRIRIFGNKRGSQLFSYFLDENKPKLYTPVYTYYGNELLAFTLDFEVVLPSNLLINDAEIKRMERLVEIYADKDKTFIIKIEE